jgi:hypothetical protein
MPTPLEEFLDINQTRPCKVRDCPKLRYRNAAYCRYHNNRRTLWGSPTYRDIHPRDYRLEVDYCREVIDLHTPPYYPRDPKGNPAVVKALDFFQRWMEDAEQIVTLGYGPPVPQPEHMARLKAYNITPEAILSEVCGLWLYANHRPDRIHSLPNLLKVIGNRVIRLPGGIGRGSVKGRGGGGPSGKGAATGRVRREVGEFIHKNLGVLIPTLAKAAGELFQKEQADALAVSQGLKDLANTVTSSFAATALEAEEKE